MAMTRILHRDPFSGVRRFGTPALGRNLEQNNINSNGAADDNLMLLVDRIYGNLSLLSIENNSLQLGQPNRPNLSRLNSSAYYEYRGAGDRWVVLGSDEDISTASTLLWDPMTDEVLTVEYLWYSHSLWGVGFDPCSGDYKVVRIPKFFDGEPSEIRAGLLSVSTGSWRKIRYPHHSMDISKYGILINGFYYWLTDRHRVIIPFDFGREEFPDDLIPLPEELICPTIVLAEYHGSLAVILNKYGSNSEDGIFEHTFQFEIWVWSNGDRSWSHLSTVHPPPDADLTKVLGLYNNDKVILLDSKGAIVLYDCGTSQFESFGVIRDDYNDYDFAVYPYYSKSKRA